MSRFLRAPVQMPGLVFVLVVPLSWVKYGTGGQGREMEHDLIWAQRARAHAKEMRALAAQVTDEKFREKLLDLATQYEKLCDTRISRGLEKPI